MAGGDKDRDPLEHSAVSKLVVGGTAAITLVAFWLSSRRDDPSKLPGVALDSPFLLDLERAMVVGALFAAVAIFLVRGWGGYFPSKLSTTGAEYVKPSAVKEVAQSATDAASAIAELKEQQSTIARGTSNELRRLTDEVQDLDERLSRIDGGAGL